MAKIIKQLVLKIILEQAIIAEEKAFSFYDIARQTVSDPEVRDLLKHLAGEELQHRTHLEELQNSGTLDDMMIPDHNDLSDFEDTPQTWPVITGESTISDILSAALQKEYRSYTAYKRLSSSVKNKTAEAVFRNLKEQEKSHIRKIRKLSAGRQK